MKKKNYPDILIPNREIKILPLQYPIHIKKAKNITEEDKGQYFVSIHRDYYSKQVKFNDMSFVFVEMMIKIHEEQTTICDLEQMFSKYEKDIRKTEEIIAAFLEFATQNNLILGYTTH